MVLPSTIEPARDSTPPATRSVSTRGVLPPPAEAFALSAMAVLHFSRAGGYGSGDSRPSGCGVAQLTFRNRPTFLPTAVQHKACRVGSQACQLDHRCTVTAITGPSSETDWY